MSFYLSYFFFFNDTATTEIYTLSLHDALPICLGAALRMQGDAAAAEASCRAALAIDPNSVAALSLLGELRADRSEEHTSELQSQSNLVCRLLLEKKKKKTASIYVCS